VGTGGKAGRA